MHRLAHATVWPRDPSVVHPKYRLPRMHYPRVAGLALLLAASSLGATSTAVHAAPGAGTLAKTHDDTSCARLGPEISETPSAFAACAQAPPTAEASLSADGSPHVEPPGDSRRSAFKAVASVTREEAQSRRRRLTERDDEERPEDGWTLSVLGNPLEISGAVKLRSQANRRLELEKSDSDRTRIQPRLEVELFYPLTDRISAFAELKLDYLRDIQRRDRTGDSSLTLARGESWLRLDQVFGTPIGIQAGRQRFKDAREWWWDEDLDALRLDSTLGEVRVEVAFARLLGRIDNEESLLDPEERGVSRILGHLSWEYAENHQLDAFALRQSDRSPEEPKGRRLDKQREDVSDADLTWLGVRSSGWSKLPFELGKLRYWADAAMVRGDETLRDFDSTRDGRSKVDKVFERRVRGYAMDLGMTFRPDFARSLYLTAGYALGSGPEGDDDEDEQGFRQTGLQDNGVRLGGVDRLRYYGELLDPNLSNLTVQTLGLGWRILDETSIDFVFHQYRQLEATRDLRSTRLRTRPKGKRRQLGREVDLVFGWEEFERLRIKLIGSMFRAGSAFGSKSGEIARRAEFELEVVY